MRHPEITKKTIVDASSALFNTQGYKATSLRDITEATGLTKGAIYRHFESKEDLEKQALANLGGLVFTTLNREIKQAPTFETKFEAVFNVFQEYITKPIWQGGCPLLNVAIEADDAHPALRKQAQVMLHRLRAAVCTLIENGIKHQQVRPDLDIEQHTHLIIASLEGAIMMSKLDGNDQAIQSICNYLREVIRQMKL
ncbi:TetR/AcrR family transcriptional regulator [Croceiramulus getboli]|nr:TetR/AcrR family transcriptional regulator [Flavobacteriaceae bacterium YJPT1-3]